MEHGDLLGGGDDCGDCGDAVTTLNDCDGVQQIPDGQLPLRIFGDEPLTLPKEW